MWSNKIAVGCVASFVLTSASAIAKAEDIACPTLSGTRLSYVQIFDGKPEEQTSLIADHGNDRGGYWRLGYVYDRGRFVTVQCVYKNRQTRDIALHERVEECRYRTDKSKVTRLNCE